MSTPIAQVASAVMQSLIRFVLMSGEQTNTMLTVIIAAIASWLLFIGLDPLNYRYFVNLYRLTSLFMWDLERWRASFTYNHPTTAERRLNAQNKSHLHRQLATLLWLILFGVGQMVRRSLWLFEYIYGQRRRSPPTTNTQYLP